MTRDEALAVILSPLPGFGDAMTMPADEWRALVEQTREAVRVLRLPEEPHP